MASGSPSSSPDTATGSGTDPARPDTGEPLGGAGSDSDSDLGLSKFDCSAMEMGDQLDGEELELEFESAADRVKDLIQTASRDQLLYLYARYKQVKVGKCNTSKPGFFDFEGQRKWQAWKQLGDMEPQQAMQEYISLVNMLDPEGATKFMQILQLDICLYVEEQMTICHGHMEKLISSRGICSELSKVYPKSLSLEI
ncbi:acyl-CoA binding domain-containing protein 6 [Ataeniobius toweri]|uniref:Acyl-CoA binding domain-containing protein 6 n=1 Tax=Ataeniobius toweri TaxID=208326 RepID=A0ABU7CBV6_9TELE|nr:acyl-CoA binding domain-containing protein 6 [Ataeniobius toweri]